MRVASVAEKRAVVRHEDQRRRPAEQEIFQPGDRVDIEMVRRLVEQQHVRLGDERPRQQHAPLHAGRKRAHFQFALQAHPREQPLDSLLRLPGMRLIQFVRR